MRIPENPVDREILYQDLIQKCECTQQARKGNYAMLRHYFLFGRAPEEEETPYNKVFPHIDILSSFLFASETTRFAIHLPPDVAEVEHRRVTTLNKAVNDLWLMSNSDLVFAQCVLWALVFDSMFVKIVVTDDGGTMEINPFPVDPGSFGVLREDMPYSDRQEAMVHSYYTTPSALEASLKNHPQKDRILAQIITTGGDSEEMPSGAERLLIQSTTPTMVGNANIPLTASSDYQPRVSEELVPMQELWLWNDDENDYQVVTRMGNQVTIYDRKNFFLEGEHPFVQVCPNPMYSFFWGASEVSRLVGLQRWRNERVLQIKELLDRQVSPPTALTGWMGITDEVNFALNKVGGVLTTDSMQAKVERFAPNMPEQIFSVVHEIDLMFAEMSGLQNIMMGKGESGVRSGRQTSELARLGSARIKKRALVIEDSLEKMATLYLRCMRKHSTSDYMDDNGIPFIPNQFSANFVVKVDGHSNSPLFVEDHRQMAEGMLEAHAIDRRSFIEMIDPPMKEVLIRRLKEIEAKEAAAQKAEAERDSQGKG